MAGVDLDGDDLPVDEFETDFDDGEAGLENHKRCVKNAGHTNMTPAVEFNFLSLPAHLRSRWLFALILNWFSRVVKIKVPFISAERPARYHLSRYKGKWVTAVGTGSATMAMGDFKNLPPIPCPVKDCPVESPGHKVTPVFTVDTARHVVYDNSEAEKAIVEFFYDYDGSPVVKGQGLGVAAAGFSDDRCVLQCVSHDLELFSKLEADSREKLYWISQISDPPPPPPTSTPKPPVVIVTSHPHGCFKHTAFGKWLGYSKNPRARGIYGKSMRDYFADLDTRCPRWRETGVSDKDIVLSTGECRIIDIRLRDNPDLSWADLDMRYLHTRDERSLAFITYSTATCPGSSGAQVAVFFDIGDGKWEQGIWTSHFRSLRKEPWGYINASGLVNINPKFQDRITQSLLSLKEET